jgi:3-dehydroquinate dehydratase/shikimate dehydrogenase
MCIEIPYFYEVNKMTINTKRLILRPWTEEDLEPFAQLNADARVREYFPGLVGRIGARQSARSRSRWRY